MSDVESVRAIRERMLLRLLIRATDTMNTELTKRILARGYDDFLPSFTSLLGHLDTEGTRISALARRMGTSRQATSQLLQQIESRGYVERIPDPNDKRAVIARHTARGRKILKTAIDAMLAIENEYAATLGQDGLARLKHLLKRLLDEVDPGGKLGLD
jgi:DNA-binding MarR family transcriptional regulator